MVHVNVHTADAEPTAPAKHSAVPSADASLPGRSQQPRPRLPVLSVKVELRSIADTSGATATTRIFRCDLTPHADRNRCDLEFAADYDERSLGGGLAPLSSPGETIRLVLDAVAGFGPLQRYLEDPAVE
jgi:hypothetical protein